MGPKSAGNIWDIPEYASQITATGLTTHSLSNTHFSLSNEPRVSCLAYVRLQKDNGTFLLEHDLSDTTNKELLQNQDGRNFCLNVPENSSVPSCIHLRDIVFMQNPTRRCRPEHLRKVALKTSWVVPINQKVLITWSSTRIDLSTAAPGPQHHVTTPQIKGEIIVWENTKASMHLFTGDSWVWWASQWAASCVLFLNL